MSELDPRQVKWGLVAVVAGIAGGLFALCSGGDDSKPAPAIIAPVAAPVRAVHPAPSIRPTRQEFSYVSEATLRRIAGTRPTIARTVATEVCIDGSGSVVNVGLPPDLAPELAQQLTTTLSAWRFEPFLRFGVATPACAKVVIQASRSANVEVPSPGPDVEQPFTVTTADTICDEVSCLLNDYVPACCAKFDKGARPRVHDPALTPDRAAIVAGVQPIKGAIMACGERLPALKGTYRIRFKIAPSGRVASAVSTPDDALGTCVTRAMRRARFAKSREGASVAYPFIF